MEISNNLQAAHTLREWAKDFAVMGREDRYNDMLEMARKLKEDIPLSALELDYIESNVTDNFVADIREEAKQLLRYIKENYDKSKD